MNRFTQPNQHSLLEAGHGTKNPENVGPSKSDLNRINSPEYPVAIGMHNPLWQEHHKAPKIEVQQNQHHRLSTLKPWYSLQEHTSLLSFFKYKLPKWKTLQQLWNSLFIGIHFWPKGTVCAFNITTRIPSLQTNTTIIQGSLMISPWRTACLNVNAKQAQKDYKERIP